jgi:molybdate transport system ATP-binding protein
MINNVLAARPVSYPTFEIAVRLRLGVTEIDCQCSTGRGVTALFGPSGAGKTSVLNMVAGLRRPDRGRIAVAGQLLFDSALRVNVPPERRRAGYIFQEARLFPHRRVIDNLLYGARGVPPGERLLSLDEALDFLGIGHLLRRWPATLSGGEAQRVAIGRALLSAPRFLLMDEPLAALDADRRAEILPVIERIRDELRLPILYVSHDAAEVARLATERVLLPLPLRREADIRVGGLVAFLTRTAPSPDIGSQTAALASPLQWLARHWTRARRVAWRWTARRSSGGSRPHCPTHR